jgi:hypothetical protein
MQSPERSWGFGFLLVALIKYFPRARRDRVGGFAAEVNNEG